MLKMSKAKRGSDQRSSKHQNSYLSGAWRGPRRSAQGSTELFETVQCCCWCATGHGLHHKLKQQLPYQMPQSRGTSRPWAAWRTGQSMVGCELWCGHRTFNWEGSALPRGLKKRDLQDFPHRSCRGKNLSPMLQVRKVNGERRHLEEGWISPSRDVESSEFSLLICNYRTDKSLWEEVKRKKTLIKSITAIWARSKCLPKKKSCVTDIEDSLLLRIICSSH